MSDLTGSGVDNTYKDLLQVPNSNSGVDSTLRAVTDGEGTASALKISTGAASVDNIKIDGNTISSTDTDGNINVTPEGSGAVNIGGTSDSSGEYRLLEDTDNGSNYIGFKAPAALTASTTFTYPDGDGSNGQVLTTNGSGTLSWSSGGGLGNLVEDTTPQLGGQLDVNGNAIGDGTRELLTFTEDGSAVNHVNIENQATGGGPIVSAAGDDANVDLHLSAKGTGALVVDGTSTSAAEIRLSEDTDNGTNYIGFKAPSAVTTSTTFTLPDGDGSANQVLQTNASGTLSWTSPTAAASQAEQETGTATNVFVSPGRQHFHQSASKAWAAWDGTGTAALTDSYNITSLTDNGTGDFTITIATDFSSADYAVAGSCGGNVTASHFMGICDALPTAGAIRVNTTTSGGIDTDLTDNGLIMFGDI